MTIHSRQSTTAFVVAPRGMIDNSRTSNKKISQAQSPSCLLTQDGTRLRPYEHQPLGMMLGGMELEALGFAKDVLTASVMGGAGDIIAQFAEQKKASSSMDGNDLLLPKEIAAASSADESFDLDLRRTLSYASFAAAYTGGFQHFLFAGLSETIADPLVRTGLNQGLIIPLCYYSLLVLFIPKLRARSQREEETLRSNIDVKKMIPRNWLFWVPLQWIQFTFIPMDLQVVYCSALGLVWNIILSLMTAGGAKTEPVVVTEKGVPVLQNANTMVADVKISLSNGAEAGDSNLVRAYQSTNTSPANGLFGNGDARSAKWMRYLGGTEENQRTVQAKPALQEQEKEKEVDLFAVFKI